MNDEATLTIRFRDESSPGGGGAGIVAPMGGGVVPGSTLAADTQNAITQAGGVGQMAARNNQASAGQLPSMAPVPSASPLAVPSINVGAGQSSDPLLQTTRQIVQADQNVTVAELAAALGIKERQAQTLLNAATVQPGGQAAQSGALPVPGDGRRPTPGTDDDLELLIRRNRRQAQEERERMADAEQAMRPPPAPVQPPPQIPGMPGAPPIEAQAVDESSGAQAAVNAISHFAHMGGPMGSAVAGAANSFMAIPGVASAVAAAAPGIAAAAPYVAAATAALAVPTAAALTLNSIAQTARGQIQGLSPEVAAAEAEANVRQLLANLRTSQRLGDEVADFVSNRSRLGAAGQGIRDVISEPLLKDFNNAVFALTKLVEAGNEAAQENPWITQTAVRLGLQGALGYMSPGLQQSYNFLTSFGGLLQGAESKIDMDNNPLTFFKKLPMPTLPAPFEEGGYVTDPGRIEFSPRMPGLGM